MMDHAACCVIYVDQGIAVDRVISEDDGEILSGAAENGPVGVSGESNEIVENIKILSSIYHNVYVCSSGPVCISKISAIGERIGADLTPTLVLVDIPQEEHKHGMTSPSQSSSASSLRHDSGVAPDPAEKSLHGTRLIQWISAEIQYQNISKLIVPVALIGRKAEGILANTGKAVLSAFGITPASSESAESFKESPSLETAEIVRYLDAGAVDVARSPLSKGCVAGLAVHAYRAHKEVLRDHEAFLAVKRGRKRSWVGVDEEKPYAYLREAMVSGLMDGICNPQNVGQPFENSRISIGPKRQDIVARSIGTWAYSAHDFSEDELILCASMMLQHALTMPELEAWRIPADEIRTFLLATRTAYNSFVPYHNFRHVVDVLQAVFYFLVRLGTLPDYPHNGSTRPSKSSSPLAKLLRPFDALTLLITAIGHDVGHPGVNNAFLVVLKAPLAQLYNDRSVLESFHCAAYSQLLRRFWPSAFQEADMRKLLINSILATDMGLHFDYMKKMGFLQEKLHENRGTDGWDGRLIEEQRTLACSLLIKCADISNVARKYDAAAKWAVILTDEFARQASMEEDLGIPSTLYAPPIRDDLVELGKSQIGFMNLFALPLFQGVTDVLPAMQFTVDELHSNKTIWEGKLQEENDGTRMSRGKLINNDGVLSPRSGSVESFRGSPEQHPPAIMATPPTQSHFSPITQAEISRPNSIGTFGQLTISQSPDQSRRSSLGSPLFIATPDIASQRSSGAFPGAFPSPTPRLQARRSSNTVPSQLQLGLNHPLSTSSPKLIEDGTQSEPDSSVVTMVVNGSKEVQPSAVRPSTASKATNGSFAERYEADSTGTELGNPANGTTYPYSPLSGATSIMSSTEKIDSILPRESYPVTFSSTPRSYNGPQQDFDSSNISRENIPSMKQRNSRFRLNFWKTKRRTQTTTTL